MFNSVYTTDEFRKRAYKISNDTIDTTIKLYGNGNKIRKKIVRIYLHYKIKEIAFIFKYYQNKLKISNEQVAELFDIKLEDLERLKDD